MQNHLKLVLFYGSGIMTLISGLLLLFFAGNSFSSFEEMFQVFRHEKRLTGSSYPFGFDITIYLLTILFLLALLLSNTFLLYRLRTSDNVPNIYKTVGLPFKKLSQQWHKLLGWEKILFIFTGFILVGSRIYLISKFPVITDEAATFVLFVSKGLKGILPYYTIPNNHFLYSILCLPFTYFFDKAFWILKLPSVIISLILFPVLYLSLRSVFRFPVAFIISIGCCFANYALYYAVHGRGYTLLLFCTFVCSLSVLKIVQQKDPAYWFWFILSGIAGFYTVPVFLYPFGAMAIFAAVYFLAVQRFRRLLQFILGCAFVSFGLLLLYLPAILVSGPEQLFGNSYITPPAREAFFQKIPFYFGYMHGAMLGQETIGIYLWLLGITALLFLLIFRKRLSWIYNETDLKPEILFWALCSSILPFIFLIIHGVMPPERLWVFLIFADFLILGIAFQIIGNMFFRKTPKALPVFTVTIMLFFVTYQFVKIHRDFDADKSQSKVAEQALRNIHHYGYNTVFSNSEAYNLNITYEFRFSGEGLYVLDEFIPKTGRIYEVLILGTNQPHPAKFDLSLYKLFHHDPEMKIYFLRKPSI